MPKAKKPKVSILVCVYNGEKFIDRCLSSLVQQTYKNTEIVIVNDGSTDGSLLKIKQYKNTYKNIVVISQSNKGLSMARNAGIKRASGDFITFVDVDDALETGYINKLVTNIKANDMLISGFRRLDDNRILYEKHPIEGSDWMPYKFTIGCAKLYRLAFLRENSLYLPKNFKMMGEDMYFIMSIISKTKKIKSLDYAGYQCYVNMDSITHVAARKKSHRNTHMLRLLKEINSKFSYSENIRWDYLSFFFLKSIVLHLMTLRKVMSFNELKKETLLCLNWLKKVHEEHGTKLQLHWQHDEEFPVNLICNIFCLFYILGITNVVLFLLSKTNIGKLK